MNPESWGFIGTLFGAIVGAGSSIITTLINSKNAIRIQNEIDKNNREERFREFQRNNLLKLQDKLSEVIRLIARADLEDIKHFKNTKEWGTGMLSPEVDNELGMGIRQLSIMTERIDNSELREDVIKLSAQIGKWMIGKTNEESLAISITLLENFDELMKKLGTILRATY
ncbi:hypothetical protein D9O36_20230 [Zobellia amurskyensis]|uniref:Uncharacterized protein n=1 Tax=Zobellia amurskyensis TaxID=248905 RepID=A0A7X2ZXG3_9FLAO|nr:hypothetical protein [Zobellia amurskyensis]MUH38182.1 hypothetical protein [Zobellia amurskyensis]